MLLAEIDQLEIPVGELAFEALAAGSDDDELVLLLHGFPQTAEAWRPFLDSLATRGYRAVAPNQRGYSPGARPTSVRAYRLSQLVADVVGIADQLGADRFHLVGHDWGGIVAWALAADDPRRVRTLTVASTPHPAAFARSLLGPQAVRSVYAAAFQVPVVSERVLGFGGNAVLRRVLETSGLDAAHAAAYAAALNEPGALRAALNWYRAVRISTWARVGPIAVPTLYVWGRRDVALGPSAAYATRDHVTGPYRFEVLDDAGHWLPELHSATLDALLTEQLQLG